MDAYRSQIRAHNAIASTLTNVNWEQRRYEIARGMMPYFAERYRIALEDGRLDYQGLPLEVMVAKNCVKYADALIKELRGYETKD